MALFRVGMKSVKSQNHNRERMVYRFTNMWGTILVLTLEELQQKYYSGEVTFNSLRQDSSKGYDDILYDSNTVYGFYKFGNDILPVPHMNPQILYHVASAMYRNGLRRLYETPKLSVDTPSDLIRTTIELLLDSVVSRSGIINYMGKDRQGDIVYLIEEPLNDNSMVLSRLPGVYFDGRCMVIKGRATKDMKVSVQVCQYGYTGTGDRDVYTVLYNIDTVSKNQSACGEVLNSLNYMREQYNKCILHEYIR